MTEPPKIDKRRKHEASILEAGGLNKRFMFPPDVAADWKELRALLPHLTETQLIGLAIKAYMASIKIVSKKANKDVDSP